MSLDSLLKMSHASTREREREIERKRVSNMKKTHGEKSNIYTSTEPAGDDNTNRTQSQKIMLRNSATHDTSQAARAKSEITSHEHALEDMNQSIQSLSTNSNPISACAMHKSAQPEGKMMLN